MPSVENATKKLMNNSDKSQITCGRDGRPPSSPAFSAAWGRVVGLVLLVLSAMPSYAGSDNKFSADLQQRTAGANSMVTVIVQFRRMPDNASLRTMQLGGAAIKSRSEEHTSELQSLTNLVCRLLLEKKKKKINKQIIGKKSNDNVCSF